MLSLHPQTIRVVGIIAMFPGAKQPIPTENITNAPTVQTSIIQEKLYSALTA